jgi:hypothetical protein
MIIVLGFHPVALSWEPVTVDFKFNITGKLKFTKS